MPQLSTIIAGKSLPARLLLLVVSTMFAGPAVPIPLLVRDIVTAQILTRADRKDLRMWDNQLNSAKTLFQVSYNRSVSRRSAPPVLAPARDRLGGSSSSSISSPGRWLIPTIVWIFR